MARQRSTETFSPLTEAELAETEKRARTLPRAWPREAMLRLIAEVRRTRAGLAVAPNRLDSDSAPQTPFSTPEYTPPGGRVTMAEWKAIVARLKAERESLPKSRPLSPQEREDRERRWEALRAQLGWDTQAPLTPEQEAELNLLIGEEIQAHRREKLQE